MFKSLSDQDVKDFIFKRKTKQSAEKEMGEWNKLEVNCQGRTITVKVNGKQVNQVSDFPEPKGSICLQCRGTPIFFRNIKLAPMKK